MLNTRRFVRTDDVAREQTHANEYKDRVPASLFVFVRRCVYPTKPYCFEIHLPKNVGEAKREGVKILKKKFDKINVGYQIQRNFNQNMNLASFS